MEENNNGLVVSNLNELFTRKSECKMFTNILDTIEIFNLESNVDYKINDCIKEKITLSKFLIKVYEKFVDKVERDDLGNAVKDEFGKEKLVINEETGEVEQVLTRKIVTILVDNEGQSYVTASRTFGLNFIKLIEFLGEDKISALTIEICQVAVGNENHKALSFKIVKE